MAFFNLPFSVRISNNNPIDGDRYIASDISARDQLISENRAYEGLQVYVLSTKKLFILKDLSSSIWEEISSDLKDYIDGSLGDLKDYIDGSLGNRDISINNLDLLTQIHDNSIGLLEEKTIQTWNGLSTTVDNSVGLGGDLNEEVIIQGDYPVSFGKFGPGTYPINKFNVYTKSGEINLKERDDNGNESVISLLDYAAFIKHEPSSGGSMNIYLDSIAGMEIRDDYMQKGLIYHADYSTNFTPRSLPDVDWVTNHVEEKLESVVDISLNDIYETKLNNTTDDFTGILNIDGSVLINDKSAIHFDPNVDDSISMAEDVGGLSSGTTAGDLRGDSFNDLFTNLLFPTVGPNLSNPYNTFSDNANTYEIIGNSIDIIFNATFDRGEIDPPYGTSGYRSGLPNTYTYTGYGIDGSISETELFHAQLLSGYVVTIGVQSWTNTVSYDEGEQPLDNKGNDYDSPLPAGTTPPKTVSIEGVYPLYANSSNITSPTMQTLVSMINGNNIVINLVAETDTDKQSFYIPDVWLSSRPLNNIETYNSLSGNWETTGLAQWNTSADTFTIEGNIINYTKYTFNGDKRGDVQIRLKF